jgi:DUF4097 and DUF4098 domain-containing protein YvlB
MLIVVLAVLLFGGARCALAERFTDRVERTFQTGDEVVVNLSNTNGSVWVEAWDEDFVELVAEKRVDSSRASQAEEAFEDIEILVHEGDGRLEIETKLPGGTSGLMSWLFGRSRNGSVSYELRVPRVAELELRTVNGNVATEGAWGSQELRSTNGRIEVDAAEGGVDAHTTNGSIRVEIGDASSQPDVRLRSTNGGITLELPAYIEGRLEARTVNGSVKTDLPVSIEGGVSRRRLHGELNGGGASRIELTTTNGSIRINESAG